MFINQAKKAIKKRKPKKRGRVIQYIYKNRIYFRKKKKTQTGTGIVSKVTAFQKSFRKRWRLCWSLMVKKNTFGISIKKKLVKLFRKTVA